MASTHSHSPTSHLPGSRLAGLITVLGATGQQGGSVTRALRDAGWKVRAVVRDQSSPRAQELAATGVETVRGDFADSTSIRAAFEGADSVFSVQPSSGQPGRPMSDESEVAAGIMVADLARDAGVDHLVYSSSMVVGQSDSGIAHFETKRRIENYLGRSDQSVTIIRPATFMEMIPVPSRDQTSDHIEFLMADSKPMQFIAVRDIGRIVARIVESPDRYRGRTLDIAGDELTGDQMAKVIGEHLGRTLSYRRIDPAGDPLIERLESATDEGRMSTADLAGLRRQFSFLLSLDEWMRTADAVTGRGSDR
ncbi:NmrA/HSCARG family protein [Gordonia sputi]